MNWINQSTNDTACNTLNSVADFCEDVPKSTKPTTASTTTSTSTSISTSIHSCSTGQDLTIQLATDKFVYEAAWVPEDTNTYETIVCRQYMLPDHSTKHKICLPNTTQIRIRATPERFWIIEVTALTDPTALSQTATRLPCATGRTLLTTRGNCLIVVFVSFPKWYFTYCALVVSNSKL